MKPFTLSGITLAILCLNANAQINTKYITRGYATSVISPIIVQSISNNAIVFNPKIDDMKPNDPRVKSLIDYAKSHGTGVSIIFFNPDNLRYVRKMRQLFKSQHIFTDQPQLAKTNSLNEFNLIKVYVIKEKRDEGSF